MFFILSKILLFLISPSFWIILGTIAFFAVRSVKWKKRLKVTTIIIAILFTNTIFFSEFCRLWEVPAKKLESIDHHDVAIVLGGMFEFNGDIDELSIRRQGDRLIQTVSLYHMGKVDKILISGDSGHLIDHGLHEAQQVKKLLIRWKIPEQDIIVEDQSVNTHENAENTVKLLEQSYPHFNKILLVTSGIHMRRALACFEKEGLTCTAFSTDLYTGPKRSYYFDQYIIPNTSNLSSWDYLMKEIVGYVAYDIVGYI